MIATARLAPPPARFAVIADIHGNADALAAVLAEIAAEGLELIVNLGDHLSGPLDPARTAETLMARGDMVALRGNHDRYLLEQAPREMGATDRVAHGALGPEALAWLGGLPGTAWLGEEVFLCHGTPGADDRYLMQRAAPEGLVARSAGEVAGDLEEIGGKNGAALVLCGHSHLQRALRLPGGVLVANPGSVGCPAYKDAEPLPHVVEAGSPEARWAICARGPEEWTVRFRLTAYDTAGMVAAARAYGREDWARAVARGELRG